MSPWRSVGTHAGPAEGSPQTTEGIPKTGWKGESALETGKFTCWPGCTGLWVPKWGPGASLCTTPRAAVGPRVGPSAYQTGAKAPPRKFEITSPEGPGM